MKLCIKKIYCPNCRQAVMGQEPPFDGPYRILCSKCGQSICISNGIYWRWTGEGEATPAKETESASPRKPRRPRCPRSRPANRLRSSQPRRAHTIRNLGQRQLSSTCRFDCDAAQIDLNA